MRNRGQRQGIGQPRRDPNTMEIDRERNCYACRGFGYIAWYCRNIGRIWTKRQFKRGEESENSHLDSNNRFHVLTEIKVGVSDLERTKEEKEEVRKVQTSW